VGLPPPGAAHAQAGRGRSYYSNGKVTNRWIRYRKGDYYGMYYKYKAKRGDDRYQYHMAYYFPRKGRYVYYYNPQTKKYWGRCPFNPSRTNPYQILNADDQASKIDDVDETKFVKLTVNVRVTVFVPGGGKKQVVMSPSGCGMPPIPGTAGTADPEPMPPPPPAPEVAGWGWDS
jgi:hypothetical protein